MDMRGASIASAAVGSDGGGVQRQQRERRHIIAAELASI